MKALRCLIVAMGVGIALIFHSGCAGPAPTPEAPPPPEKISVMVDSSGNVVDSSQVKGAQAPAPAPPSSAQPDGFAPGDK